MDSRPTWSVDGSRIAFLRDDSSDLDIWVLDIETGDVQPIVETDAIELDPIYSSDGEFLYYSSGQAGTLDIWRFQLATAERMPVTSHRGIEIRPLPLDGQSLVFLSKGRGGPDRLVYSNRETGLERTLRTQSIMSQTHPGLSPDGKTLAVNWPSPDGYDLYLVDWNDDDAIRLNARSGLPISPAFSHDGKTVYFVEANDELEFELFAVPATGGKAKRVPIRSWDWGVPLGASSSERRVRKARPRWRRAFMSRTPTVTPRFRPARACLTSMVYTARFTSTRPASSASKYRRARCVSRQATVFRQRPSHGRYRSSRARWHWWIYRSSFCGNRARTAGTPQTTTTI